MARRPKLLVAGLALTCLGVVTLSMIVRDRASQHADRSHGIGPAAAAAVFKAAPGAEGVASDPSLGTRVSAQTLPLSLAPLAYAQSWHGSMPPAMAAFREWTYDYLECASPFDQAFLELEGIALARARRAEMFDLIASDPELALALTVPAAVRVTMPASIEELLEERVSGRGDYEILMAVQPLGARRPEGMQRRVSLGGRSFNAFVYGRRSRQTTKEGASLHGIAIDGRMAVHESPLRVLEPGEVVHDGIAAGPCPVSAAAVPGLPREAGANLGAVTVVEVDGKPWQLASAGLIDELEADLVVAEDQPGPSVAAIMAGEVVLPLTPGSWTTGNKSILIIRVDFSDKVGEPIAYQAGLDLMNSSVNPYYDAASYGTMSITPTVTTKTYRMPRTAEAYATGDLTNEIYQEAAAAAGADYTVSGYDHVMVVFKYLGGISGTQWKWAGLGQLGGGHTWINGYYDFRVTAHEFGHNLGLHHANLWQVTDGNPVSPAGTSAEYEDPFDVMGGGSTDARHHFNPWFKNELGWLPDTSVLPVTASGTYRLTRFDDKNSPLGAVLALNVFSDGKGTYWIGFRQNFTANPSLYNGAYVIWGFDYGQQSHLFDMTTPGSNANDAGLQIGATFTDTTHGLTIRPVAKGGTSPAEYLDVEITLSQPASPFAVAWGSGEAASAASGVTGIRHVVVGSQHGLGLRADGTVTSWGSNSAGQTSVPTGLANVVAISARANVSGAVRSDGTVALWGNTSYGQTAVPAGLSGVTSLSIGGDHVLALKGDGTVVAWGDNAQGESTVPSGLSGAIAVAAGSNVSYAVRADGTVARWGSAQGTIPSGLSSVVAIAVGTGHALALKSDGTVVAWGSNTYGQATVPAGLGDVLAIAAGAYHSVALKGDGTVVQWGYTNTTGSVPIALSRVSAIAANDTCNVAIVGSVALPAPTFSTHPQDAAVEAGETAQFSAMASGADAVTYQWQYRPVGTVAWSDVANDMTYTGATSSSLTVFASTEALHGHQFRCVASYSGDSPAYSDLATLSVTTPLVINTQPISSSGMAGGDLSLSVSATSAGEVTYQWRIDGVDIAGATSSTLRIGSLQAFHAGTYSVVVTSGGASIVSDGATVTVAPASASTARPLNLSTRAMALAGEAVIPGFVIAGTGTKRLLIRAVGPTLGGFGLGGTLADPRLTLTRLNPATQQYEALLINDDWGTNTNEAEIQTVTDAVGAFSLDAGSADAAVLVDLAPGQYTVVAEGKNGTDGLEMVELYDADSGAPTARLVNISNRGYVGTGDALMIPGFVVSSEGSRTFLIRAVGPGLASTFGLTGVLDDPQISIYKRSGENPIDEPILTNDNWDGIVGSSTTSAVAVELGAFELEPGSRDAAFVVTLSPGVYTVHATGVGATTGVALVEVYLVP